MDSSRTTTFPVRTALRRRLQLLSILLVALVASAGTASSAQARASGLPKTKAALQKLISAQVSKAVAAALAQVKSTPGAPGAAGPAGQTGAPGEKGETGTGSSGPPSGVAGGALSGSYPRPTLAANVVTSASVSDHSLIEDDFGPNSVGFGELITGSVKAGVIADGAVTTSEIASGAVTSSKLAAASVDSTAIADNSVAASDLSFRPAMVFKGTNAIVPYEGTVSFTSMAANSCQDVTTGYDAVGASGVALTPVVANGNGYPTGLVATGWIASSGKLFVRGCNETATTLAATSVSYSLQIFQRGSSS